MTEATRVGAGTHPQLAGLGGVTCRACDGTPVPPGVPGTVGVRPHALDPQAAERLWTLSERPTGVRFER